jgi:AcrR family transcriptional regulator
VKVRAELREDEILDAVIDLIEAGGYETVQVREVANKARISLATLYKLFGTLDELIIAALERWMDANVYESITIPKGGEPPYETLVGVL